MIKHNNISGSTLVSGEGLHALKLHGENESDIGTYAETGNSGLEKRTAFTMVADNVFGSSGPEPVSIGPQSPSWDERLSDIIILHLNRPKAYMFPYLNQRFQVPFPQS